MTQDNKNSPLRIGLIALAFVISIFALSPTKSTDVSISGGAPSAELKVHEGGRGFQSSHFSLRIDGDGKVGETEELLASVLDGSGAVVQANVNIGAGYEAGKILTLNQGLPVISLGAGEVATGSTYHIDFLVEYMNLGLDLVGGSEIEYRIPIDQIEAEANAGLNDEPKVGPDGEERVVERKSVDINEIVALFNKKLNNSGLKEIFVQSVGRDRVLIQLPGLKKSEVDQIKKVIETQGNLEFRVSVVDEELYKQATELMEKGVQLPTPNFPYEFVYRKTKTPEGIEINEGPGLLVQSDEMVTGKDIVHAKKELDTQSLQGGFAVAITFNAQGGDRFADLSELATGKSLAIVLDGALQSAPTVKQPIYGGQCQITGGFTAEEADALVTVLRSGSMDVKPELLTENTVGPTLGSDSIDSGLKACLLGAALVLAFMAIYYKGLGLVAIFALSLNMLMLMGSMALFGGTLTLPGIAGFALTIGMAVDATVLIFERLREESEKKQHVKVSLTKAYGRAFVTIFDSNFTTFITALILYLAGNSAPVKGFCLSLMLGLSINLFAAVFVTKTILIQLLNRGLIKEFKISKPFFRGKDINFFALGGKVRIVSYLLLSTGIVLTATRGSELLDIDFTGGNFLQVSLEKPTESNTVRDVVKAAGQNNAVVQNFGEDANMGYTIRTAPLTQDEKVAFIGELQKALPTPEDTSLAFPRDITVGGVAATEMLTFAFMALIAAMLVILLYIMMRFYQFKYGVAACIALFHDVGITIGLLAAFGIQINLTIFAAILTVIGYSLNDTIVIFDRIRENIGVAKNYDFKSIAIRSLNQTLNRTILTSLTTAFVVLSLVFLGGGVIQGFALTMLFGVLTGTYSSLFIAAPFVLFLHQRDKKAADEKEGEMLPKDFKPDPNGKV